VLEIALNLVTHRRHSWISLIVAAAISVGITQSLVAQPSAPEKDAPAAQEAPPQLKTLAVVAGARYEKLLGDVTFLGPYLGQPAAGQLADAIVAQFTMGKAATALDRTKPWGLIVQTDGAQFYYVACLPVANVDDVIEIAKAHNAEVKDGENGTKELSIPNKPPVFLKAENGVAFLSLAPASLAKLPPNALEILSKRVGEYDLSVSLAVKNIPPMYRQFAIGAMQAGLQQSMKKLPDESDEQFADRQRLAEGQITQMTQLINEIDTVKVGLAIDAQAKRTFLDFEYQLVPGSKMAKQIAAYAQPNTNFAGFYQPDAAATAMVATKADPKLIADDLAQFDNMMRSLRHQAEREIDRKHQGADPQDREALKAATNDVFDAIEATVKEGQIDAGASLNASPNSMTFIAGVHLKEPGKIEDALKKLETAAKRQPDFPGIKWNAANHAGVNFHTMTAPVPEDKKGPRKMFGETVDISFGIGPDAVYVAFGKDNIAAVSKAIDASAADRSKTVPPFAVSLSLGPIIAIAADAADGPEKAALQAVADKVNNQANGRDHIRVTGEVISNGLRYRIEAEEGVLQAVGTAAMLKARARNDQQAPAGN
jgi:hypothetical protein